MECKLIRVADLPTNEVFIGEIVGAYANDGCCTDGQPGIEKIKPFTLTLLDNRYWEVGPGIGKAWSIGKGLKQSIIS